MDVESLCNWAVSTPNSWTARSTTAVNRLARSASNSASRARPTRSSLSTPRSTSLSPSRPGSNRTCPLTQAVERFASQHQVGDHQPDRDRRGQLQPGIIGAQRTGQQRGKPEPIQDVVDDRQPTQGGRDQRELVAVIVRIAHHDTLSVGLCVRHNTRCPSVDDRRTRHAGGCPSCRRNHQALPGRRTPPTSSDPTTHCPAPWTSRHMRCGKANCRCKAEPPILHGPYLHWTRTVAGKTVTLSLIHIS